MLCLLKRRHKMKKYQIENKTQARTHIFYRQAKELTELLWELPEEKGLERCLLARTIFEQLISLAFIYQPGSEAKDREKLLEYSVKRRQLLQLEQCNDRKIFAYPLKKISFSVMPLADQMRDQFTEIALHYMKKETLDKDYRTRRWYRSIYQGQAIENLHDVSSALCGEVGEGLYTYFYSLNSQFTHGCPYFPEMKDFSTKKSIVWLWKYLFGIEKEQEELLQQEDFLKKRGEKASILLNQDLFLVMLNKNIHSLLQTVKAWIEEKRVSYGISVLLRPLYAMISFYGEGKQNQGVWQGKAEQKIQRLNQTMNKLNVPFLFCWEEKEENEEELENISSSPYRLPIKDRWCKQIGLQYLSVPAHGIAFPYFYTMQKQRFTLYHHRTLAKLNKELYHLLEKNFIKINQQKG